MKKSKALNNRMSLEQKESLKSWIFFLPLLFGLVFFFLIPIVKSFLFSVSDVISGADGYRIQLTGFSAYYEAFYVNNNYRQEVVKSAQNVLTQTPLIIIFSFFIASVLNQEFKGRTIFRVILFLPLVLTIMNTQTITLDDSMSVFSDMGDMGISAASFTDRITEMFLNAGLEEELVANIIGITTSIYGVIDQSAIQILIILVGMQAISPSLYEAAKVEGATAWESFWKITFPMVSPMIITCIIYTIIDSFTSMDNGVMALINGTSRGLKLSLAAAMGWVYFLLIAVLLSIVAIISSKFVISNDN